ncbi:putative RNA-binding protein (RRM superfamily) [Fusarium austroafricanum]|uniref:Putative RNA-binding protein (RRM superfamily) n=1 Tax=Fusarium austroafricanum TaxID=2364996 RepID=A0A8H4KQ92_9HYPO|nr:putative RNA-binding protein (RRM superfamily) [Fusarium austroafricanum]
MSSRGGKLAPEVNRALFVKNLSYNVTPEELFDLFGKFGPIRQVRQGIANNTKGTAFVVYEDVTDAKQACDKLNGFNFQNRYLVVLYHQPDKMAKSKEDLEARRESLAQLKKQHGTRNPLLQAGLRLLPNLPRRIRRRSYEKAGPRPTKQPLRATHPPESSASMMDFDLH